MNTIGKTLVVLNLVFALLVGGFLVIDFATRTNWKTSYETLKREMDVSKANSGVSGKTLQELVTQVKRSEAEKEELKQKLVDQEKVAKAQLNSQKLMTEEATTRAGEADLNTQKAIAERDRLKLEINALSATVQNRDATILTLQTDNKKYRTEAIAQENIAKATQSRNEYLLGQNQDLLRKLALKEAGVGREGALAKDPNAPNPPPTYLKGKIDKVDPTDRTLAQISLGSDQGLKQNQTLEVFRLGPDPQYIGMIRIVDAKEHVSVGKLTSNSRRHTVASGRYRRQLHQATMIVI